MIPRWAQDIVDWGRSALVEIGAYEVKLCEEGKMFMFRVTNMSVTFSMGIRSEDGWLYSIFSVMPGTGQELVKRMNVRLVDIAKEVKSVYEEASILAAIAASETVKA